MDHTDISSATLLAIASAAVAETDGTPAQVGERVLISFRPPESAQWIDAEATVVRLVTGRTPGAPGIGLRLEPLAPFERGLLSAALELSQRPREPLAHFVPVRRTHSPGDVVARQVVAVGASRRALPEGVARMVIVV